MNKMHLFFMHSQNYRRWKGWTIPQWGILKVKNDASTCYFSSLCYSSATEWKV